MSLASLPMILYLLPAFTILAALVPARRKPLVMSIGGLSVTWFLGGFPAMLLMMFSVCSSWLVLRVMPLPTDDEHSRRARFTFYAGICLQILWVLLAKLLLGNIQTVPLMLCAFQNIDCLRARAKRRIHIPSLYMYFCYQCDMTRMFAGPILSFSEYEDCRAAQKVSAERIGEGASLCIRGVFQLVCLSRPMQSLHRQLVSEAVIHTVFDALLSLIAFFFAVYFALKGAAQLGQGIAKMLGYQYPDSFHSPVPAESLRDFWKRFMIPLRDWTHRVMLRDLADDDSGAYFVRIALLLGGIGLTLGNSGGLLWGVCTALFLTAERRLCPAYGAQIPVPAKRIMTACVMLFTLGFASNGISSCFSFYGALLGFGGIPLSETAGYLMRTSWLSGIFCIAGLLPFSHMSKRISRTSLRIIWTVLQAVSELCMLLLAYAELLSQYIRSN